jgi:putative transposase
MSHRTLQSPRHCSTLQTVNVLDKLPQSVQSKAKQMLHDIYLAPSRHQAEQAWDYFVTTFGAKYPKAVASLTDQKERLLTFYDYPAEHWHHIRTTNVIESTFATVRLRTVKTKGCGTRMATLTMVYKLVESASKRWLRLRGHKKMMDVLNDVPYRDGIKVTPVVKSNKPELTEV